MVRQKLRAIFINYTGNGAARNIKDACEKTATWSQYKMCIKGWKSAHLFTVSDFINFNVPSQAAAVQRAIVAEWYKLYSIGDTRNTCDI